MIGEFFICSDEEGTGSGNSDSDFENAKENGVGVNLVYLPTWV